MAVVTQWVRNLVFIILFTTILEMFLPEKNMKKYVRVVMGLFIISILIAPLSAIFNQNLQDIYQLVPDQVADTDWQQVKIKGVELDESNQALLKDYYSGKMSDRIAEVVNLDFPDWEKNITVEVDGDYQLKQINIGLTENIINKIRIEPVKIDGETTRKEQVTSDEELAARQLALQAKISQLFQVPAGIININLKRGE